MLQGWKEKLLSQVGREVLLKAVVQAIPTFAMSCFKLPVGLCNDIEAMIQKFWWGQRCDCRRILWKKWDILCQPKSKGGLGFRELGKFNEAMLAKQVWRLVHDTDSLFYRVFKAKYFPTGTIFYAKAGSGSYAWKSILKARKVIQLGARWRIGDGSLVKIFKDSWLPNVHSGRVLSLVSVLSKDATVDQLLDNESRWWNTNLVDTIFIPLEAQQIKSIPVCHSTQKDFLFWPLSRTDMYQVRSRYHLLCNLYKNDVASSSDTTGQKNFWNRLWKLNIPNKVKIFLWRACTDSIPTMLNLHKRRIVPSSVCCLCHVGEEFVLHALWFCQDICSVWGSCFTSLPSEFSKVSLFRDLLELVFCSSLNAEVFAMTCWSIWSRWNKLHVGEGVWPLKKISGVAQRHLQEFQQVRHCPSKKVCAQRPRWKPLDAGLLKVNFDGAIFDDLRAIGIGVTVRNEHGEVVAALAEQIPIPDSIFTLETLAARRVVLFARDLSLHHVVF